MSCLLSILLGIRCAVEEFQYINSQLVTTGGRQISLFCYYLLTLLIGWQIIIDYHSHSDRWPIRC